MATIQTILALLAAIGIPTAFSGFLFRRIEKRIEKRESTREERDKAREKNEVLIIKGVGASIALGEACALALKNGRSNGETEAALEYARKVKHEQKDFLTDLSVKNLY